MRLVLHIGHTKTASSFVQAKLFENRAAYRAAGVAFPTDFRFCGGVDVGGPLRRGYVTAGNATILSGYRPDSLGFYDDPARWARFWGALRAIEADTVVLSCELLFHLGRARVDRIADAAAAHGFEPRVTAWISRQDQMMLRVWAQHVRAQRVHADPLDFLRSRGSRFLNYPEALATWAAAFGRGSVSARTFHRDHLTGGDVWRDFLAATGLPEPSGLATPSRVNESLPPRWLETVRRANRLGAPAAPFLVRCAERAFRPRGDGAGLIRRYMTPELWDALAARYACANERLIDGPFLTPPSPGARRYWRAFADAPGLVAA